MSDLATGPEAPVRLGAPQWSNSSGFQTGPPEAFVRSLCNRINEYSGAVVSFEFDHSTGDLFWHDPPNRVFPTLLTMESAARNDQADLVLVVLDPVSDSPLAEIRHTVSFTDERPTSANDEAWELIPTPAQRPPRIYRPRASDRRRAANNEPEADERRRGDEEPSPRVARRESGDVTSPAVESDQRPGPGVRSPQLDHVTDTPEGEDVERISELECGRILFLDRKASERIEPISDICRWSESGELTVEVELVCTRKDLRITVRAEFFDAQGRGVNRTPEQRFELAGERIRGIRFESGVPAGQVVLLIDRD